MSAVAEKLAREAYPNDPHRRDSFAAGYDHRAKGGYLHDDRTGKSTIPHFFDERAYRAGWLYTAKQKMAANRALRTPVVPLAKPVPTYEVYSGARQSIWQIALLDEEQGRHVLKRAVEARLREIDDGDVDTVNAHDGAGAAAKIYLKERARVRRERREEGIKYVKRPKQPRTTRVLGGRVVR